MKKYLYPICLLGVTLVPCFSRGQDLSSDYPERRAIIANVSADIGLKRFTYSKEYDHGYSLHENFTWGNTGKKEVVAFELVVLHYDPFNDQLLGSRGVLPGHNSAKHAHLLPGEDDSDGFSGIAGNEDVFTAVLYVRSIRFADGTVWRANPADVIASIKKQVPDILDPGSLVPEHKKQS